MIILAIQVEIFYPHVHSLKEKRKELNSIIARLNNQYNLSVKEVSNQEKWQRLTLGISHVSLSPSEAQQTKEKLIDFLYENTNGEIIEVVWDLFSL